MTVIAVTTVMITTIVKCVEAARQNGYRDGFNDGADAAREGDRFHPQNSGDWQKGTNGYEDRFGNKNAYRSAYRDAYMQGYRAGFDRVRDRRGETVEAPITGAITGEITK